MNRAPVHIRCPEHDETPLSDDERLVAIREGFHPAEPPKWHPAIVRNWSLMSARMHRAAALADHPAHARATEGAAAP